MIRHLISILLLSPSPALSKESPVVFCNDAKHLTTRQTDQQQPVQIKTPLRHLNYEYTIDGDTIVADGHKIRLWGIDAPEKSHHAYMASKLFLETFLEDSLLSCKFINKDRYARDVMHCFSDDIDIGALMVKMGMATDYKKYSGGYYQFEQKEAKDMQRGIWKKKEPEPLKSIACTMEAKLCPDGSAVSPTGPNCAFASCP